MFSFASGVVQAALTRPRGADGTVGSRRYGGEQTVRWGAERIPDPQLLRRFELVRKFVSKSDMNNVARKTKHPFFNFNFTLQLPLPPFSNSNSLLQLLLPPLFNFNFTLQLPLPPLSTSNSLLQSRTGSCGLALNTVQKERWQFRVYTVTGMARRKNLILNLENLILAVKNLILPGCRDQRRIISES